MRYVRDGSDIIGTGACIPTPGVSGFSLFVCFDSCRGAITSKLSSLSFQETYPGHSCVSVFLFLIAFTV